MKLNKKGYMLVEIILAFSIAFILLYFMMDLVIKLKNKNDDLLVETLVKTDQTIITNKLMDYAIVEEKDFDCEKLKEGILENSVNYGEDIINIVNKYTVINKDNFSCSTNLGKVSIVIPLEVKQMSDKNFDVIIDYKYDIGDMTPPVLTFDISLEDNQYYAVIKCYDEESGIVGDETTKKNLSGTSDVVVSHTCVNNVGLETFSEHRYKFGCKSYGSETCSTCFIYGNYVCDLYSNASAGTALCGGIPDCVSCHRPKIPYPCYCNTPCNLYGFDK